MDVCVCWPIERERDYSLLIFITNLTRLKPLYDKPTSSKHPVDGREMRDDDDEDSFAT